MNSVSADRSCTTARTSQIAAGIRQQVACRLLLLAASAARSQSSSRAANRPIHVSDQTALPELLPQIAALLGCDQFPAAERLLQAAIGGLTASVPPQSPQLREWLLLALFAVLHEDPASADAYLRQAERQPMRNRDVSKGSDSPFFVLQLTRCLVNLATQRSGAAEELLDACEAAGDTPRNPHGMWLLLQLRTVTALLASQYRAAWQTWQAAMAIQQTQRCLRSSGAEWASRRLWLQTMASREVAAANN